MVFDRDSKDELKELIIESKIKSEEIKRQSGDLLQWSQYMIDLADASEKVAINLPSTGIDWKDKIDSWKYLNQQQYQVILGMKNITIQNVSSSGNNATYAMADFTNVSNFINSIPYDIQGDTLAAAVRLGHVIDRFAEKEKVMLLLKQYGLINSVPGRASPVELFNTAWAAFEQPIREGSPAATSLIPVRECINSTISELLRRRPRQEPAKSAQNKIMSICKQLAVPGYSPQAIQYLAERWNRLVDELSDSKQRNYSREEWRVCLLHANLFLMDLLQCLDQSKMK